jgi:hypothetical protein
MSLNNIDRSADGWERHGLASLLWHVRVDAREANSQAPTCACNMRGKASAGGRNGIEPRICAAGAGIPLHCCLVHSPRATDTCVAGGQQRL